MRADVRRAMSLELCNLTRLLCQDSRSTSRSDPRISSGGLHWTAVLPVLRGPRTSALELALQTCQAALARCELRLDVALGFSQPRIELLLAVGEPLGERLLALRELRRELVLPGGELRTELLLALGELDSRIRALLQRACACASSRRAMSCACSCASRVLRSSSEASRSRSSLAQLIETAVRCSGAGARLRQLVCEHARMSLGDFLFGGRFLESALDLGEACALAGEAFLDFAQCAGQGVQILLEARAIFIQRGVGRSGGRGVRRPQCGRGDDPGIGERREARAPGAPACSAPAARLDS